jgi:hypothetical protein
VNPFFLVFVLGRVSDLDPHSIRFRLKCWIRIRNADPNPDPGGVKSVEIEGENEVKRQTIHPKMVIQCIKTYLRQYR